MSIKQVVCHRTDAIIALTSGAVYEVLGTSAQTYQVINDEGNKGWYCKDRFNDCPALVPHKWAKELHAFADGHKIQYRNTRQAQGWCTVIFPTFRKGLYHDYRIEPFIDEVAIADTERKIEAASAGIRTANELIGELQVTLFKLKKGVS